MAKLINNKQQKERKRPYMSWQLGDYDARGEFKFIVPYQTLLLCRLTEVTPRMLILDFLENIHYGGHKRQDKTPARTLLADYFIAQGYGSEYYSENDIRQMFAEMDALSSLFPWAASRELLDAYCAWRDLHQEEWFSKWFNKGQRPLIKTPEL